MAEAENMSMTKEHRAILRKHRTELEENLQPLKLLSHLTDVVTPADEEDIRAERTTTEQTVRLLDILPRKGGKAFEAFVRALEKKQRFLAIAIAEEGGIELLNEKDGYNEYCMQPEHKEILRSNRGMLSNIKLDKILLLMQIVFDSDDIQEIKSKSSDTERFDEFMSILMKKEDKAFHHFVNVLDVTNPSFAKFLMKEEEEKKDLKNPTQINPEDDTEISKVKNKLFSFCEETNKNEEWKSLARELEVSTDKVQNSSNPTETVLDLWSSMPGKTARVGELKTVLTHVQMIRHLHCLENDLSNPKDTTDAPADTQIKTLAKRTENLLLAEYSKPKTVETIGDLSEENQNRLLQVIEKDRSKMSIDIPPNGERQKYKIRELTRALRQSKMEDSIKWMKKNLPSGVTGPWCDENMNVRDLPYSLRSRLTIQLCANDNWKILAERLGLSNIEINYFDSPRFKNPADEVLKTWETKRNSTIGDLYDILVSLNMPVIADSVL